MVDSQLNAPHSFTLSLNHLRDIIKQIHFQKTEGVPRSLSAKTYWLLEVQMFQETGKNIKYSIIEGDDSREYVEYKTEVEGFEIEPRIITNPNSS